MPNLPGNPPLLDITFPDSTTGYAVTDKTGDTSYVYKTTNGGTNWFVNLKRTDGLRSYRLQCISKDTVYFSAYFSIYKTINGGSNWTTINIPGGTFVYDLFVLNKDTMWYSGGNISTGVLYRTTNAGATWDLQYTGASLVDKIYMYNARIGFVSAGGYTLKTVNGGFNWTIYDNEDFHDIHFKDSLIIYKTFYLDTYIKKSTNGGINWINLPLPVVPGYIYTGNSIKRFSIIGDTIYGVRCNLQISLFTMRAIIYKSTNGGLNWGYQLPDTNWGFATFFYTKFVTSKKGWCHLRDGIFTNSGGDTTIILSASSNTQIVPNDYILYQNYPNPFNSMTNVKFQMLNKGYAVLKVFDIAGREITTLINGKKSQGNYEVKFDGNDLSSGIYFYSLFVDGIRVDTKKAVLIK